MSALSVHGSKRRGAELHRERASRGKQAGRAPTERLQERSSARRPRRRRGKAAVLIPAGFVPEHVLPVNLLIKQLLADLAAADSLRPRLEAAADRVVITTEEDSVLIAGGVGSSVPTPGDPWSRYTAADTDPTLFAALA
jgi:hypothetical protein